MMKIPTKVVLATAVATVIVWFQGLPELAQLIEPAGVPLSPQAVDKHHEEKIPLHSPCSHVEKLYNNPPRHPSIDKRGKPWDMSKERILVLSGHGAPHADTIYNLLEMGFPQESLYSFCFMRNCFLSGYFIPKSGLGVNEWANKSITGTNETMLQAQERVRKASQFRWWKKDVGEEKLNQFFQAIVNNDTHWDGGIHQHSYNKEIGDAMSYFTAVICPFPSKICAPFLDDKFSHLKVILRLSHRISHWDLQSDFTLSMLKRLVSHPSRFLISSNNAFDMIAMESLSLGNNWMPYRNRLPLSGLDPIPLDVLFWPSYYRHVREYSPDHPAENGGIPLVIEAGARYTEVSLALFDEFHQNVSSGKHKWRLHEKSLYNMTDYASLVVVFPYSTHSAKVNEFYARSLPMVAPSIDLLVEMAQGMPADMVLPHIGMSSQFLSQINPPKLCLSNSSSPLHQWVAWSDIYTHPFIRYFDSFQDLPRLIDELFENPSLLQETRLKMKRYWDESYNKTSNSVITALEDLFQTPS